MKLIESITYREVKSGKKMYDIDTLIEGLSQWAPQKETPDFYFEVDENDDVVLFANLKLFIGDNKTRSGNYVQIETAVLDKRTRKVYCLKDSKAHNSHAALNGLPFYERGDFVALDIEHAGDAAPGQFNHYHHSDLLMGSYKTQVTS